MQDARLIARRHLERRRAQGWTLSDCIFGVKALYDQNHLSFPFDLPTWSDLVIILEALIVFRNARKAA